MVPQNLEVIQKQPTNVWMVGIPDCNYLTKDFSNQEQLPTMTITES